MKPILVVLILSIAVPGFSAPPPPAAARSALPGVWTWTCCSGKHSGTFQISTLGANGSFTGKFGSGPSDGNSPLVGQITGDQIQFTRTILVKGKKVGQQQWQARVILSDRTWQMSNGDWDGYARAPSNGGFSATKTSTPVDPPPALPGAWLALPGPWTWTCCSGKHSGTFQISTLGANGSFTGKFGSGPSDGDSPLVGQITADRIQFTRTILINGKKVGQQQWKARVILSDGTWRMSNGDWAGYARAPSNGGFSATKSR